MLNNRNVNISLITPSYNQGEYLEQCIDSVLSQNYPNLEYIIMDGGSSDNSVEIIKKYEKHLKYWVSEPDKGQSHAINKGLKLVTGEVFNWLCSDDYLEQGSLFKIAEAFLDPKVDLISGDIRVFEGNEEYVKEGTVLKNTLEESLALSFNIQPATFFRTRFYKEFGYLNEDLHYLMDKEFLMKYLFAYGQENFLYLDTLIAHYRIQKESKTFKEMDNEMLRPNSKFKIDNNSIYYSLATQIKEDKIANTIKTLTDLILADYQFILPIKLDTDLTKKVLSTYLLNEAKKWFYKNEKRKALQLLKVIDTQNLNKNDKKDYFYLYRNSLFFFFK